MAVHAYVDAFAMRGEGAVMVPVEVPGFIMGFIPRAHGVVAKDGR